MPVVDSKRVSGGSVSFERGVSSGLPPNVILDNQIAFGINVTMRNGYPVTRPGFRQHELTFQSEEQEAWFKTKNVQAAIVYVAQGRPPVIFCSIGGRVFLVHAYEDYSVQELTGADVNSSILSLAWLIQAEDFALLQDGQSKCFIYDGSALRRAGLNEIPTGTRMAYGNGRLWVAIGRSFVAGDIYGTNPVKPADSIIQFTENDYFNEGGTFTVPSTSGITAMGFTTNLDSSLGDGELTVHSRDGVWIVSVPSDRTQWKNLRYPVQRLGALQGAMAQDFLVNVNSDQWYRGLDGIRSFIMARRDFQAWGNVPQSFEMNRVLVRDSEHLLQYGGAVLFDNRFIWMLNPAQRENYASHAGLGVLDFTPTSGLLGKGPPAYDGIWTGMKPVKIFTGDTEGSTRCFMFTRNLTSNENELWEISKKDIYDTVDGAERRIACVIESKSFGMDSPMSLKRLETGDAYVADVIGAVDFDVKFRPDQYMCWLDWHAWSECAQDKQCDLTEECVTLKNLKPQYRPRMRLPQPPDDCEDSTGKMFRDGYEFQTRIAWTGHAKLKLLALHAEVRDMEPYGECREDQEPCAVTDCCEPDPYAY